MIRLVTGTLLAKSPTEVWIDVHGIGYSVHIPLTTFDRLPGTGKNITLHTYLHVREDALQLFGFIDAEALEMFRLLISVSGIGPRMALGILSGTSVANLKSNLIAGHFAALTAVPGIGKKLAERMVVELRDKLGRGTGNAQSSHDPESGADTRREAVLALTTLGYTRQSAERAVQQVLAESSESRQNLETIIKAALRLASR